MTDNPSLPHTTATRLASECPAWAALEFHYKTRRAILADMFAADSGRREWYTLVLDGLNVDLSRNHIDESTLELLTQLACEQHVEEWRDAMFAGAHVNISEDRAALHTAMRANAQSSIIVDGVDIMPEIVAVRRRMEAIVQTVRTGKWLGASGKAIRHVINIGIGGSDLGPRLVVSALRDHAAQQAYNPTVRFVANVDLTDLTDALAGLDPAETLFVVVSKTFATAETLMNATAARRWLVAALGEDAVKRHFLAVSVNLTATAEFGISAENTLPMRDWVGGRYSLWSAVGLAMAIAIGWDNYIALLGGAAAMDKHFRTAPIGQNIPIMMALTQIWYRNFYHTGNYAVLPYCERLRDLPRMLQQLMMESNGKAVTRDGRVLEYATSPVIFGECGTVGQHSFHQLLHQGTDLIPVDFIGITTDSMDDPFGERAYHHTVLAANMMAQAEALLRGRPHTDPARVNPGNRPSTTIKLDRLDPHCLGLLLAMYEHTTFSAAAIWGINPFDQWGVELGKELAKSIKE